MSKTFLKTDGDIREVLRTMFRSPEFWAPEAYRARVKTPFEFVVSSLRATQADITDPQPLLATLNKMGMPLYGAQPPTGYSTKADVWVNSAALLDRMNFGLALSTNHLPGMSFNLAQADESGCNHRQPILTRYSSSWSKSCCLATFRSRRTRPLKRRLSVRRRRRNSPTRIVRRM